MGTEYQLPIISLMLASLPVGALLMWLVPAGKARAIALGTALVDLCLALYLLWQFDAGQAGFQFVERREWIPGLNVHYLVGLDGNISENPRFENRAAGDYRPAWDSPCAGAGPGGSDMGALAAAPAETGIPGWGAWWEGIGVSDWEAEPGAGVFEDYSGDGELNIFKFFRSASPDE